VNIKKWLFSILMFGSLSSVSAQETNDLKKFPAQISIIHPVGTHGRQSINHAYNLSLNLFTGKNGRVNGLEISGIYGFCGGITGVQIGGIGNIAANVKGIQVAGLGNLIEDLNGIHVGGVVNHANNMKGIQVGGFGNNAQNMKGIQIGGFGNRTCNGVNGIQIGGVANRTLDGMKGIQIGGVGNEAKKVTGLQICGIYNLSGNCPDAEMNGMKILREEEKNKPAHNEAVWRNGGISPAESAVRIWRFAARRKFSVSRHYAKPLGRWLQVADSAVQKGKMIRKCYEHRQNRNIRQNLLHRTCLRAYKQKT
jgi:hypothetical protein